MSADVLQQLLINKDLIQWTLNNRHEQRVKIPHNDFEIDWLDDGILLLEPSAKATTDLVISCGVHGNETAPIEMVEAIFTRLIEGHLALKCRLLVILGNIPAMAINRRFCEENLNRLFSGKHTQSPTQEGRRAARIEYWVEHFYQAGDATRIHLDLHTAIRGSKVEKFAIYPYPNGREWSLRQLQWLSEAGIEAVLLGHQPSGTFSYYTSATYNAMAFTLELGKALAFGENDHSRLVQFKSATESLISNSTQWSDLPEQSDLSIYRVVDEVLRTSDEAFELQLADDFLNFTPLTEGEVLSLDEPDNYVIKNTGHRVVFPNKNVPVGQRVALVIEPCDIRQIQ